MKKYTIYLPYAAQFEQAESGKLEVKPEVEARLLELVEESRGVTSYQHAGIFVKGDSGYTELGTTVVFLADSEKFIVRLQALVDVLLDSGGQEVVVWDVTEVEAHFDPDPVTK